jgi:hypothetical protein
MISSLFHRWHFNPYRHVFCDLCAAMRDYREYIESSCD